MNASYTHGEQPQAVMTLSQLCAEAGIPCPPHGADVTVKGVTADSRRVREGWLFVALKGYKRNGEAYIPQALQRGAAAIVTQTAASTEVPIAAPWAAHIPHIMVENTRRALACLCDAWYAHPARKLRLVGVSGTNGKTSVSAMLAHILRSNGIPCGVIGTVGHISPQGKTVLASPVEETAHMTTPDPEELYKVLYLMASEGADGETPPVVVMEVTSHALALDKTHPLHFEVGIFTNLSPEHLDFHRDMEDYYLAKRRLFTSAEKAVINAHDPYGKRLLTDPALPVKTYYPCYTDPLSFGSEWHPVGSCRRIYASRIALKGVDGVEYRMVTSDARLRIKCPVPGSFTVVNSLEAAAAALALGVPPTGVQAALACFGGVPGRMERVSLPPRLGFSAFLDYAHTPDALENLLLTAKGLKRRGAQERVVVLFGCGGDRDPSKRAVMASIASRLADMVIITSDNSRTEDPGAIISDIMEGLDADCPHAVIPDRAEAIRYAVRHARQGDILLLAGKGHETYELDKNGQHPFCEREILLAAAEEILPKE